MSESNEGLPEQVGQGLPERVRETLKHPFRRQILRSLEGGEARMSASEIARGGGIPCSLSCTGYHLRVLESSGLVAGSASEEGGHSVAYQLATPAGEQEAVRSVLEATASDDRQRFATPVAE
jgi:DNA-binding transcriptional ArsR family regulator